MLNNHTNTGQGGKEKGSKTLLIFIGIFTIALVWFFIFKSYPFMPEENAKYSLSNMESLDVDLESAEIYVEAINSSQDKIDIEAIAIGSYKTSDIDIETKGDTLYIKQTGDNSLFNIRLNSRLKIYVTIQAAGTDGMLGNLDISSESGNLSIENVNSRNIAIRSESGEIVGTNVSSDYASISSSSAEILLNQMNIRNQLKLKSQSGEIRIKDLISDELSIQTKSGAINVKELVCNKLETKTESGSSDITLSDKLERITADSSSTSGSIDYIFQNDILLDVQWTGEKINSRIDSDKNASNHINLTTDSGAMSVNRK